MESQAKTQARPMTMLPTGAGISPAVLAATMPWAGKTAQPFVTQPWFLQAAVPRVSTLMAIPVDWMGKTAMPLIGKMAVQPVPYTHPYQKAVVPESTIGVMQLPGMATGLDVPSSIGAFRIPGFSVAVDTPLLQGALRWPGMSLAGILPGMQGILGVPSSLGAMTAPLRWRGALTSAETRGGCSHCP